MATVETSYTGSSISPSCFSPVIYRFLRRKKRKMVKIMYECTLIARIALY